MVDAEVSPDGPSGRDVLVQGMHLGDAQRAPREAPAIAFRVCIMLVRRWQRATQTPEQSGPAGRRRRRQRSPNGRTSGCGASAVDALGPRAEAMRATTMFDPAEWVIRE